jgi:hypothetical protein
MKQTFLLAALSWAGVLATNLLLVDFGNDARPLRDCAAWRAESPPDRPACQAGEHVIDLPEDGHLWHTILIVRPDWQTSAVEKRAESIFHSEPLLVSLKRQTHWHLITTDEAEFQPFRPLVSATPCLIVERANGEVVYRESGPDLGKRPHQLTHALRREIERHCPDGRCLPLHPVPDRENTHEADEIPAVLREAAPPARQTLSLAAILTALAGLCGGVAANWRKTG